jgi:hypothetical protein
MDTKPVRYVKITVNLEIGHAPGWLSHDVPHT